MSQNDFGSQEFQDNPYQVTAPLTPVLNESNQQIRQALRSMARWQNFFAVLGFIGSGLMLMGVLVPLIFFGASQGGTAIAEMAFLVAIVGFTIVFYLIPSFLLLTASKNARLLANTGLGSIGQMLESQRKFWRYLGMLTCIAIGIYCLVLIVAFTLGNSGLMF